MSTDLHVRDFKRVVFFTGAGMSAESGVPTYRGQGGIWHQYNYQDYACQEAFDRDPARVWEFHNVRRQMVASCEPNDGHKLVAKCEQVLPHVTVVTQNIDGLHQRAGSKRVFELHGSMWRLRCAKTRHIVENLDVPLTNLKCADGCYWRPDIVWFGDQLNHQTVTDAVEAIASCDLLVSIGTSAVVYPAADFPRYAKRVGATLVEINPQDTPLSDLYDLRLRGTATEMLARLTAGL